MLTKIANKLGFWTKRQIATQYTSGYEGWKDEHREWMKAHGLKPLTFE